MAAQDQFSLSNEEFLGNKVQPEIKESFTSQQENEQLKENEKFANTTKAESEKTLIIWIIIFSSKLSFRFELIIALIWRSLSLSFVLFVNFLIILLNFKTFPNIDLFNNSFKEVDEIQIISLIDWIGKKWLNFCLLIILVFVILRFISILITFWFKEESYSKNSSVLIVHENYWWVSIKQLTTMLELWHCAGHIFIVWLGLTVNQYFYALLIFKLCFVHINVIENLSFLREFFTFTFILSLDFIEIFVKAEFISYSNKYQVFYLVFSLLVKGLLIIIFEFCIIIIVVICFKEGLSIIYREWGEGVPNHAVLKRTWRCIVKSTSVFRFFGMNQSLYCLIIIFIGTNVHPLCFNIYVIVFYTYSLHKIATIIIRIGKVWLVKFTVCFIIIHSITNISYWIYKDSYINECQNLHSCAFEAFKTVFKRNYIVSEWYFLSFHWASCNILIIPPKSCFENPITKTFSVNETKEQNTTSIEISANFPYQYLELKNVTQEIPCTISLKGMNKEILDAKNDRQKLDIICIIDKSGSMDGDKFNSVKETLVFLLNNLTDSDRLSIVAFEGHADRVIDLTETNDSGKINITDKINEMEVGISTNISSGLEEGFSIAEARKICNRTTTFLLLTDGQDGSLTSDYISSFSKRVKAMIKGPYFIHTFGYGADHDSKLMKKLSGKNNGNFYYIENPQDIPEAFTTCLGDLAASTFEKLEIELISQNCSIKFDISKVFSENGENHWTIPLLLADNYKDLVFLLKFPPYTEEAKRNEVINPVKAILKKSGEKAIEIHLNILIVSEVCENRNNEANIDVLANYYRCKGADILRDIIFKADEGNYEEAKKIALEAVEEFKALDIKGHEIVKALINDLEDASNRASSKDSWGKKGGRAQLVSVQASHFNQKASNSVGIYKNVYQRAYSNNATDYFKS